MVIKPVTDHIDAVMGEHYERSVRLPAESF